ncbi:MAG: LysM peptidoglycan-binding domain-containing protein [Chloroflexi bacterium]|nr:LysM peptidoglycan-binding domain-containing protein [Chloroflexota bacterium]
MAWQVRSISPYERWGEPGSASAALMREHICNATETLTGLAHRYYGDWRLWRVIADANGIIDPRRIAPGTRLLIPPRPIERGTFESV